MKNLITVLTLLVSLAFATPGVQGATREEWKAQFEAWLNWYESRNNTTSPPANAPEAPAIDTAAFSINNAIVNEAGGDDGRYLEYSRRLAMTLNEKSKAELRRVFDSSDTLGLGH